MTVLKQPYKIVIDWSMTLFWKALTWQLMAMCHWLQSITRNLWPSVIDCDQWQKNYGQIYKKCHWLRSMTKKSVIDWMYTIYGYYTYNCFYYRLLRINIVLTQIKVKMCPDSLARYLLRRKGSQGFTKNISWKCSIQSSPAVFSFFFLKKWRNRTCMYIWRH